MVRGDVDIDFKCRRCTTAADGQASLLGSMQGWGRVHVNILEYEYEYIQNVLARVHFSAMYSSTSALESARVQE